MAKLSKDRLIFGVLLIVLVALGEIVLGHFKLATWPAFMVMIFFFEAHMDMKKAANILVGGLFGIANLIIIKIFLEAAAPSSGAGTGKIAVHSRFCLCHCGLGRGCSCFIQQLHLHVFSGGCIGGEGPGPQCFIMDGC